MRGSVIHARSDRCANDIGDKLGVARGLLVWNPHDFDPAAVKVGGSLAVDQMRSPARVGLRRMSRAWRFRLRERFAMSGRTYLGFGGLR
jgi:hypothetical protein